MKKMLLIPAALAAALMTGCTEYLNLVPAGTTADSKLAVCHVAGPKGKYKLISVKASAAQAHADHGDFLAPAGAKKDADCVPPVVVPPVVVPPTGTPTTVDTTVVVPPVVVPPVVVPPTTVDTPVVVPPVVVPPVVDTVVEAVKELPTGLGQQTCYISPWLPECEI
jgi:hypothetical protein